jgi:broad specificity phosphatase PhoE
MYRLIPLALLLWSCCSQAATIILIRHAERAGAMGGDPPLSDRGKQRAEALVPLLKDKNLRAIFITDTLRTRQTVAPLANRIALEPVELPGRNVAGLIARLKKFGEGDTVLVVGHSNTLPEIVEGLGGSTARIGETEFDRMITVVTHENEKPTVTTTRYGN